MTYYSTTRFGSSPLYRAAIDAPTGCVNPAGDLMTVDQRFFSRPVDGNGNEEARCDIGSVEKQ